MGNRINKQVKRHHNRVYLRNEYAIQKAILTLISSCRGRLTMRKVAKVAGITRQTIYNHYPNINHAVMDGENDILKAFSEETARQSKKLSSVIPNKNYRLFYATMSFMAQRWEIFALICSESSNQDVLSRMSEIIFLRLDVMWLPKGTPNPAPDSQRAKMLVRVMAEILREWVDETNCNVRKADRYIQRMLRAVADAAANRLP